MIVSTSTSSARILQRIAPLMFAVMACGGETAVQCLYPPCAIPQAIEITVSTGTAHNLVPDAYILTNQSGTQQIPCSQGAATTCNIFGSIGEYDVDIAAPGYQTVHRHVVVTGTVPKCGCPTPNLQRLSVSLDPVA